MHFIDVIIPLSLPKTFTYLVSESEFNFIQNGMRVAVSFGKTKIYTGLAVGKHQNAPTLYEAKEIHQILDQHPIANQLQIDHWFWIASYYMCSIGEVFRMALPSALMLESETIITYKNDNVFDEQLLSDDEFLIFEALQNQSSLKIEDCIKILNKKNILPIIQKLLSKNIISLNEEMVENYKPKLLRYIRLNERYIGDFGLSTLLELLKNATKQKDIVLAYFQLQAQEKKSVSAQQIEQKVNASAAALRSLITKSVFEEYYLQEDRVNFDKNKTYSQLILSAAQNEAFTDVLQKFTSKNVVLLHGITASGKTEIYIKLIEQLLLQNQQILYLLPEIALTTQLVSRLTKHFGNEVAVYHSKYSNNERVEVWNQVLQCSEKAKIVIGARSALFLPFSNLALIIVDEEHETTFKQENPAPRYHARDAAIVLANLHQAKVLLGSATPSLETYYNAKTEKYGLVTVTERYGKATLPKINVIDLKEAYARKQMNGHFSSYLIDSISAALNLGEQVILFQNRRGYSPILECITCGHIPQCTSCNVSLTYHKFKNQLRCHYCGYAIAKPTNCHACSSTAIETKGFGTEQIELELAALFPTKNVKRMDQDTTRGKYAFEKLIDSFKNRQVDILVGTQMLAKGLDFDNVSLVGILNADTMLYHPDFRAFERSYQLMTQVAGRAGRADKIGQVVVQTYAPLHPIVQQVQQNDYAAMFTNQMHDRQIYFYPPYFKLIKITLKHKEFDKLKQGAFWMYEVLKQNLPLPVLGPEEPAINRIRNDYIRTILIKIPNNTSIAQTKKIILKSINSFDAISQYRTIKVSIDVDC